MGDLTSGNRAKAHVYKLRQSILAKAFRGELVPKKPTTNPQAFCYSEFGRRTRQHMEPEDDAETKAATTYNAASDYYDDPVNSFWERFGRRTVERLNLSPGARVLDVCCGSGASATHLPRRLDQMASCSDLAGNLLDLARGKARQRGLNNVEFHTGDMLNLGLPESSFDAVVCVFGIFFVPAMSAAVRDLWKRVRVGGKLEITTWGPGCSSPRIPRSGTPFAR
jgi:ubiquinone/menaquinone biosynthesis C-methylase UbiE